MNLASWSTYANWYFARLGSDEFGLLLYQCPLEPAQQIANMLRGEFMNSALSGRDKTFSISVSIGLVVLNADTQSQPVCWVQRMLPAMPPKQRAESRAYVPTMMRTGAATWRNAMGITNYKSAGESLPPVFPAVVPIANREEEWTCRSSALGGGNRQIVSMAFIPAAERYQLMHLIDRWVISTLFLPFGAPGLALLRCRIGPVSMLNLALVLMMNSLLILCRSNLLSAVSINHLLWNYW